MATVVLAGGGTAGHIEPALAVARQWAAAHPHDQLIFLGTSSGLETTLVPAANFPLHLIPRVRISRTPSASWLKIPVDLLSSVRACSKVIKGSSAVVGFGGYVSAPAYIAAKLAGVPIVIHEANAKPGWANRLGAVFTDHLAVAHPVESGKFSSALLAGLPLRSDVAQGFVAAERTQFSKIMANVEAITLNLRKSNDQITGIIGNTRKITDELVTADFKGTILEAQTTLKKFNMVLSEVEKGQGTLGKLIHDDKLYAELVATNNDLQNLVKDLEAHPERYVHISLIGGKTKPSVPLTSEAHHNQGDMA